MTKKKILIHILIILISLSFITGVSGKEITLGGINFNIPVTYSSEKEGSSFYTTYDTTHHIGISYYTLSSELGSSYGYNLDKNPNIIDKTINKRPIKILEETYANSTYYDVYLPIENTIYCLSFDKNSYKYLDEIIKNLPSSNMTKTEFNGVLEESYHNYLYDEIEDELEDEFDEYKTEYAKQQDKILQEEVRKNSHTYIITYNENNKVRPSSKSSKNTNTNSKTSTRTSSKSSSRK